MYKPTLFNLVGVLALSVAGSLHAAEIDIYGRAHVSVDQLDDGADYGESNFSSNSSRIGFRGEKEYGLVTALLQIEQGVDISTSGGELATRDTFVGLRSDLGTLRLGKFDTPFKKARGAVNLFGEQIGDMRNLSRAGEVVIDEDQPTELVLRSRFDERTPNTVHYQTPTYQGMALNIAYSLHEGDSAIQDGRQRVVSSSVTYVQGKLDAAFAWERHDRDRSGGKRQAFRLASAYKVSDPLRLLAFFQQVDHDFDDLDSSVYGVGAEYALTTATYLKGMYLARDAELENSDASMLALGIEHRIDRALRVYLNYASVDNQDQSALTPWQQGRTLDVDGAAGEVASAVSLGLRFDF